MLTFIFVWCVCYAIKNANGNRESLDELLQEKGLLSPPWLETGEKTIVTMSLDISNLEGVAGVPKKIAMIFDMHQTWNDPRLAYNDTLVEFAKSPVAVDYVTLPTALRSQIWMPDVHIKNAVSVQIVESPTPNYFLRIYPNGTLFQSMRINCVLVCPLAEGFPHHYQRCNLKLESYSYSIEELLLVWKLSKPVDFNADIQIPSHELIGTKTSHFTETFSSGAYSCLSSDIDLERIYNVFPAVVYFPSSVLVFLAWSSFWIDRNAIAARTSLCALIIMAEVTHSGEIFSMMASTSIWVPVEVWIGFCLFFTLIAALEYVVVHTLTRLKIKQLYKVDKAEEEEVYENERAVNEPEIGENTLSPRAALRKLQQNPGKLDTVFRVLFPVFFIIFNICYWLYYLV